MIRRLFLDHPAGVGETYTEHFAVAVRFGALHRELVAKRGTKRDATEQARMVEWVI